MVQFASDIGGGKGSLGWFARSGWRGRARAHVGLVGLLLLAASACSPADELLICEATPQPESEPFVSAGEAAGLTTEHHFATDFCELTDTIGGPGTCLLDYDSDGDLDIYFVDRAPFPNRLYRNDGGTFSEQSQSLGADLNSDSMGCLAFDYDGDGDVDLFVANNGRDQLLRNDDGSAFVDVSDSMGLTAEGFSVSATAGDIDADGDLDLFVTRPVKLETCPDQCFLFPAACEAENNLLWENRGDSFVQVAAARGIDHPAPSLAALFVDFDVDGDLDLYVGNDMGIVFPDRMYINDGTGHFVDRAVPLGLDAIGTDTMGVDVGDYDRDGRIDMVITDFKERPIRLFHCFDPTLPCSNEVAPDGAAYVKWGIALQDFDNDGDLDLFTSNGDVADRKGDPNYLYFNAGDGRFVEYIAADGDAIAERRVSRGSAFGDMDNDGDVDIVIASAGGQHQLLLNQAAAGHSLTVTLEPMVPGARVTVSSATGRLTEQALIGGSYASSSDPRLHFGLGDTCVADVTVRWPSGKVSQLTDVPAGQVRVVR